ncbi:MAG: GH3 auxin-responsive promoter family protein [Cytophagales bacterium]|nr:GH3 auxin-responsive promoter family protein [Cytophagales bacterium]
MENSKPSPVGGVHSVLSRRVVALTNNWEEKIERLARETIGVNVTHIAGVPTWTVLLLQILAIEKKSSVLEVWPNLEVFFHGAVAFKPYKNLFKSIIPSDPTKISGETYNASEGFFGIQDQSNSEDLIAYA